MTVTAPVLELRDLHVTYGGTVPAVRGVNLAIGPGETVGLAGESGCGKSTIAAAVLRLLPRSAQVTGEVLLAGEDVYAMKPGRLRAVRWTSAAIVFQGALHSLNPVRRVGDQVAEAIELHPDRLGNQQGKLTPRDVRRRVAGLFEAVGLPAARVRAYPHQLSGGQRQRVLIALALACDPVLLIADEPTTALDVMVQAQVLELLAEFQRERGLALLFITHDLSVLTTTCERLAVMYAGRIVEDGPGHDVFGAAGHPYSAALARAFPTIGDRSSRMAPAGLPGDPPHPGDLPPGCPFHPRCAVSVDACTTLDVGLRQAAPGHTVACVHVGGAAESGVS
ncbi:MAG TPA: ABC transporter ATP-binding protein [Ilumatobacter sp.]|nr:ABC transporter ATP-binding protein [Ilumatobacter sp.]